MRKILRSRRAMSPVVAAIILIAVTVAVSIAVAAWMGALTFTFMKTEELKITSHEWVGTAGNWTGIKLYVTNTGTAALTLDYAEVSSVRTNATFTPSETLASGGTATVEITYDFTAGIKYEFAIVTKAGGRYTYVATAPS